jgi:hypothetical protein
MLDRLVHLRHSSASILHCSATALRDQFEPIGRSTPYLPPGIVANLIGGVQESHQNIEARFFGGSRGCWSAVLSPLVR